MVIAAVWTAALLVAVTVALPTPLAGAVHKPVIETLPTPDNIQVTAGWLIALPNLSVTVAVNCSVAPSTTIAVDGVNSRDFGVCWIVTVAVVLVTLRPPWSVMAAVNE
jgi:hypothetical protein